MKKVQSVLQVIVVVLVIMLLTVQLTRCEDKHRDKINYKEATFIYNEELLCYKELVQAIDDYQFEKYNDTILIGKNTRNEIDYLEKTLDSIYSVNK